MQYLKALVIGMGVLIFLGVGLLAYGLFSKTASKQSSKQTTVTAVPIATFGDITLPNFSGCHIRSADINGSNLVLVLEPDAKDQAALSCDKVVIFDTTTSQVSGTITLAP